MVEATLEWIVREVVGESSGTAEGVVPVCSQCSNVPSPRLGWGTMTDDLSDVDP